MRCILCGKPEDKLYDNLCQTCFRARNKLLSVPELVKVTRCAHCNSTLLGKRWLAFDSVEKGLQEAILKSIEFDNRATSRKLRFEVELKNETNAEAKIFSSGMISGLKIEEEHSLKAMLRRGTCNVCSKKFGGYYESIVQVRGKRLSSQQISDCLDLAQKVINNIHNKSVFLTSHEEVRGGIDFYLSRVDAGKRIARALAAKYSGKVKTSKKLVTRREGKDVYRVTFSVRLP